MKDVALGSWLIVIALMLITGSALCIGHLKLCFLLDLAIHCFIIGQHTLHNFHLLLTAIRVTDYNVMYGGPNLTREASKC